MGLVVTSSKLIFCPSTIKLIVVTPLFTKSFTTGNNFLISSTLFVHFSLVKVSRSFLFFKILLFGFFRIIPDTFELFHILPNFFRFFQRYRQKSSRFFQIFPFYSDCFITLQILSDPCRLFQIFPDFSRFFEILSCSHRFPQIPSESFKFSPNLPISFRFFRIFFYCFGFFRMLFDASGLFQILSKTPSRIFTILSNFWVLFRSF